MTIQQLRYFLALCQDLNYTRTAGRMYLSRQGLRLSIAALEEELLQEANALGIGPQGLGGDTSVFRINIEHYPTHIAGLPCAVNISCHVTRHAKEVL